jgi:hypothetical protein
VAGILVFDGIADAPLRGATIRSYPNGRFIVVLDPDDGSAAALEAALVLARSYAVAAVTGNQNALDAAWLEERCDELNDLIEQARTTRLSIDAAARAIGKARDAHDQHTARIRGFAADPRAPLVA